MNSSLITNLPTPTANDHAANKAYVDTSIPIGGIIMWSGTIGTSLPSNWKLCDGSTYNSIVTPDLRGRFVLSSTTPTSANGGIPLGAGLTARNVTATGGAETVALEEAQMPQHKHGVGGTYTTNDNEGAHSHTASTTVNANGPLGLAAGSYANAPVAYYNASGIWNPFSAETTISSNPAAYPASSTGTYHKHTVTVTESNKGSGTAHENMPPFYVLAFIMRIS